MKVLQGAAALSIVFIVGVFAFDSVAKNNTSVAASGNTSNLSAISANSAINEDMPASKHLNSIVLGAGCFWGAEKRYAAIPGVVDAVSGYADGSGLEPKYSEITKLRYRFDSNNYAEVVKVTYNESVVDLETILENYFEGHDPTQVNRQGNDVGTQYRSTILTSDDEQMEIAQDVLAEYQALLSAAGYGKIATRLKPLDAFHAAEEYHQDYLVKNPNGYCPDHSTGVVFNPSDTPEVVVDNSALQTGKHVVIVESKDYCPYCEKLKADVLNDYDGDTPVTFRLATQLDGLAVKTPTWATPTVLILEDGKEVFGRQGYMTPEEFYVALGERTD